MAANRSRPRRRLPAPYFLRQQILETVLLRQASGGRITVRSSRPRIVASATCFCATLARVRRPATGRLNSGVRRQKNVRFQPRIACSAAPLIFAPLPSLAAALVVFSHHAMLRIVRLARSRFTSVAFVRFLDSGWCGLCSATDTVASETPD